jgi:hypothetical protein
MKKLLKTIVLTSLLTTNVYAAEKVLEGNAAADQDVLNVSAQLDSEAVVNHNFLNGTNIFDLGNFSKFNDTCAVLSPSLDAGKNELCSKNIVDETYQVNLAVESDIKIGGNANVVITYSIQALTGDKHEMSFFGDEVDLIQQNAALTVNDADKQYNSSVQSDHTDIHTITVIFPYAGPSAKNAMAWSVTADMVLSDNL